jgi:hypothetical protein
MNSRETFEASGRRIAETRIQFQKELILGIAWQTCLNCEHWTELTVVNVGAQDQTMHRCGLFSAVPPPHIIVNGCRDYEAKIPF